MLSARAQDETQQPIAGEPRWPMTSAVAAVIVLQALLQTQFHVRRHWLMWVLLAIEGLLLLALMIGDPGAIDRRSRLLRGLSIGLVCALVVSALWATTALISDLISGGPETNSAGDLLWAGAAVWVSNNIAFALLYWELDRGGAAARAHRSSRPIDLAFPQDMNPAVASTVWRPQFVDYFYLGFTNATAFSPTDVMPLAPWAKLTMTAQSLVSLLILSLVIARAVNVLT
jgi:hypothetical protein